MMKPSLTPSNLCIYSDDDHICSYTIQPKIPFLNSDHLITTVDQINNLKVSINEGPNALTSNNRSSHTNFAPFKKRTEDKNPLILIFDTKTPEIQNIQTKKNKYHDLIFQKNSNEPISVQMKNILKQIYPKKYQSCFIDSEQDKKETPSMDLIINASNKIPEVTTSCIKNYPQVVLDDLTNSIKQKQQIEKILIFKETIKKSEGINEILNKNGINNKPVKPRQNFTEEQRSILNSYLQAHSNNPYAGSKDVARLVEITGLQPRQIRTYFTNKRMRDAKCMNLVTAKRCRNLA